MAVPLLGQADRRQARLLIERQGLRYEPSFDAQYGVFEEGRLVATAARKGNIFKLFAIEAEWQGSSVLGELVSALVESGVQAGYPSFFLFTTPQAAGAFQACHFHPLIHHQQVCLLEFGNGLQCYLQRHRALVRPGRNGAVVVNCNPFTLGHRYLIEEAARRVDHLYVFLVREDRSFFPYEVRLQLVRAGLSGLPNVSILESGDYAISAVTFPGYFLKQESDRQQLQMELDLLLFRKHLAPFFHIATRFIGTEPYCRTTRQYSELMQRLLPPAGLETVQIDRYQVDGEAVSAYRVRQAWRREAYETLRRLVPASTLAYLRSEPGQELQRRLVDYQRRH